MSAVGSVVPSPTMGFSCIRRGHRSSAATHGPLAGRRSPVHAGSCRFMPTPGSRPPGRLFNFLYLRQGDPAPPSPPPAPAHRCLLAPPISFEQECHLIDMFLLVAVGENSGQLVRVFVALPGREAN